MMTLHTTTISATRRTAPVRQRATATVAAASVPPPRARITASAAKTTTTTTTTTSALMTMMMTTLMLTATSPARAAIECNLVTPCTPPPPNGEPRYTLPGAINSPGEDAVARYMAKLEAAKGNAPEPRVETPAPATRVETPAE